MKHSSTYPFRRWYRRPLTPRESAVIGLLERRRRRTGRVSIVLTVSAAEHAAISRLLLHYALFLNNRCYLSCTLLVTTTRANAAPVQIVGLHPGAAATGAKTVTDRATPHPQLLTPHCAQRNQLLTAGFARSPPLTYTLLTLNSKLKTHSGNGEKPASLRQDAHVRCVR